ncbi:MAG: ECF-type sigma factor [Gemmatimonadota bacterium]|nr:ECF-type sigma factor [Gemmatimonadota bacterium]MDH4348780.1 ECF-type sigma factor [Gemmatimonadota bacterium]MDH5196326.1 ECF-type sigma factor [Gemmatimonadota bacterium]
MESRIVQLVDQAESGKPHTSEQLFAALYHELHRVADAQLRRMGPQFSLGTTTLLHETYLDLAAREGTQFPDRARFLGYAARAMRGLVIDYVRRAQAQKRGGGAFEITLTESGAGAPATVEASAALERLSEALDELAALEPSLAQLVDLHFFSGYSFGEIAGFRGVSERTVQRDWRKARLLLHHALADADMPGGSE